jgi:hypothetical protein
VSSGDHNLSKSILVREIGREIDDNCLKLFTNFPKFLTVYRVPALLLLCWRTAAARLN